MKEDQTQLITARLEHLQFMMDSGKMTVFRQRSDMFLFALEAYNIARGLSSRYYRMQEDLDIRFFVRFRFDYWLKEIQKWIHQLEGAEYRVDDDNFFAEGRAKRLTIVVDRLFGYHTDRLPADSADGSMPLSSEEILEPFRAILDMKSTDLVASFREALKDVHKYLLKLAMLPIEWPDENRRKALLEYLEDASQTEHVQNELNNYRYFCRMPDGIKLKGQFCYLRQRLLELTLNGELAQLRCAKSDQQRLLDDLRKLFGQEEFSPSVDEIPVDANPMADDELFAKFLYFVHLEGEHSFPVLDADRVSNYLTRKDVYLSVEQEQNLQALFALMGVMRQFFDPILEQRYQGTVHGGERQDRVDMVMNKVKHYNSCLSSILDNKREVKEVDDFFARLFSPDWIEHYGAAQDALLHLFEKGRDAINLKPYIQMLRVAVDSLHILRKATAQGKQVYQCLKDEDFVRGISEDTVQTYFSKTEYKLSENWAQAITLVDAVAKEYTKNLNYSANEGRAKLV